MNERHATTEECRERGRYEIRLAGHLDIHWAERFEGLSAIHESDGSTVLSGPVRDQAELYGLLKKVRDLGIPLVSICRVASPRTGGSIATSGQ